MRRKIREKSSHLCLQVIFFCSAKQETNEKVNFTVKSFHVPLLDISSGLFLLLFGGNTPVGTSTRCVSIPVSTQHCLPAAIVDAFSFTSFQLFVLWNYFTWKWSQWSCPLWELSTEEGKKKNKKQYFFSFALPWRCELRPGASIILIEYQAKCNYGWNSCSAGANNSPMAPEHCEEGYVPNEERV